MEEAGGHGLAGGSRGRWTLAGLEQGGSRGNSLAGREQGAIDNCRFRLQRLLTTFQPTSFRNVPPSIDAPHLLHRLTHRSHWRSYHTYQRSRTSSPACSTCSPSPCLLNPSNAQVDPQVALALVSRFPTVKDVESRLQRLLTASASEPRVQALPAAAMLLASHAGTSPASLAALEMWAPAGPVEGLQLLASPAGSNPAVKAYALRCIANTKPEKVRAGEGG